MSSNPVVVTHDGSFHADEVMAMAVCQLFFGVNEFSWIRTRDEKTISKADYVFDVGNIYDPDTNRFDHHMKDCPVRSNNYNHPYSSAGLAWMKFGRDIIDYISKNKFNDLEVSAIFNKVDNQIFVPIDLVDNGIGLDKLSFTISNIVGNMNPTWDSEQLESVAFEKAVSLCRQILVKNIKSVISDIDAVRRIKYEMTIGKINTILNNQVLLLPIRLPYVRAVYSLGLNDVKFVIVPENGNYLINTIPDNSNTLNTRMNFPEEWAGLRNEDLVKVTGIPGSLFCHTKLFIAGATSLEAAKEMARVALMKNNQGWKTNDFTPIG